MTIEPFGGSSGVANLDVSVISFLGASVVNFNASADYAGQQGSLSVKLVEDDVNGDKFTVPVIGSPQAFIVQDNSASGIFSYRGLVESISRDASPDGGKTYTVNLASPLKILESTSIILDGYAGYGRSNEGIPQYTSIDGYYEIAESGLTGYLPDGVSQTQITDYFAVSGYALATNNENLNYTGMWGRLFNLYNVFGAYENDSVGLVAFKGFGAAGTNPGGMRFDKVVYALDQLINHTASGSTSRYLGGSLLYGTSTYNICSTAGGYSQPYPYYYGFDIIDFAQKTMSFLPEDFIVPGPSITIADLVSLVCEEINATFNIVLNDAATYKGGSFTVNQTYPSTTLGGILSVTVIYKNQYVNCNRPFSDIAYSLIALEEPNFGSYGTLSGVHPGIPGTGYLDPLDDDYVDVGTRNSNPAGGSFVADTGVSDGSLITETLERALNTSIALKASPATTAKMVVGGYQTRMNIVPREYIYQYWGDITLTNRANTACGIYTSSKKSVPVITHVLPPNDMMDVIMIDMQDIFGDKSIHGLVAKGVYFASVVELRATSSFENWNTFLQNAKKTKYNYLNSVYALINANNNSDDAVNFATLVDKYLAYGNQKAVLASYWEDLVAKKSKLIKQKMYDKVREIHNTYYGKQWIAPIPFFKTKLTQDNDTLIGNYVRSWDLTNSAYVEPYALETIEAPRDSSFIEDGRIKTFITWEYSFQGSSNVASGIDVVSNNLVGFINGINYKFDFSEYNGNFVTDFEPAPTGGCRAINLAYTAPSDIDAEYSFLPQDYFDLYNRTYSPLVVLESHTGVIANLYYWKLEYQDSGIQYQTNIYPFAYTYTGSSKQVNTNDKIQTLVESLINDPNNLTQLDANYGQGFILNGDIYSSSGTLLTKYNQAFGTSATEIRWDFDAPGIGPITGFDLDTPSTYVGGQRAMMELITTTGVDDNALYNIPVVRFKTERVYYPAAEDVSESMTADWLGDLAKGLGGDAYQQQLAKNGMNTSNLDIPIVELEKPAACPRSIGIPQKSNRYVYGPWVTQYSTITFAGKVEYEQDENLVPENFIIPVYGNLSVSWDVFDVNGNTERTISSITGTSLSGFAGMNLAGQAKANAIDNFSLFAEEEGTITVPGLPIVSTIGSTFLGGPLITDINTTISNDRVETTYNFRSLSSRFGKTNRDVMDKLLKLSNTVKKVINKGR